jgi:DGQHR domain-containing protein
MGANQPHFTGFTLQSSPHICVASIPGKWLLKRTTPIWRIENPIKGFQRVVRESRAREIAIAVLDQRRTFPNAIVLATDVEIQEKNSIIYLDNETKFLVVDGQHRLWAQNYSDYEADFACIIHAKLTEVEMATLFLEINDNQKRVPSSLRWDLVRLVRPEDDPLGVATVEIIYELATEKESPLFQRIDLTGEQSEIQLKQGSLAPEIRRFLQRTKIIERESFELAYDLFFHYFVAIKEVDGDEWGEKDSAFYKARVLRALIRLLEDIIKTESFDLSEYSFFDFIPFLNKIYKPSLDLEKIRDKQGSAGIKAIYDELNEQVFGAL